MAEAGNNSGILPFLEALSMAREAGLDLVEVDPNSSPPVCRILDYGKWKYSSRRKSEMPASGNKRPSSTRYA